MTSFTAMAQAKDGPLLGNIDMADILMFALILRENFNSVCLVDSDAQGFYSLPTTRKF